MARGRKRKIENMNFDEVLELKNNELKELEENLFSTKQKIKDIKTEIKKLEKDRIVFEEEQKMLEEEKKRQEIAQLIIDSGKSLDEIEKFLKIEK